MPCCPTSGKGRSRPTASKRPRPSAPARTGPLYGVAASAAAPAYLPGTRRRTCSLCPRAHPGGDVGAYDVPLFLQLRHLVSYGGGLTFRGSLWAISSEATGAAALIYSSIKILRTAPVLDLSILSTGVFSSALLDTSARYFGGKPGAYLGTRCNPCHYDENRVFIPFVMWPWQGHSDNHEDSLYPL